MGSWSRAAAGLQRLHDVGRLGGAAAGVQGGEPPGIPAAGEAGDKKGDIGIGDLAAVLRPYLDGGGVGDDILTAVPGDMVVDPPLQRLEEGGFAVVAASGDEGDPPGDPHPPGGPPVGQFQRHRHGVGGEEGHRLLHGPVGDAALPGEHRAVGHKGGQPQPLQFLADKPSVLRQGHGPGQFLPGDAAAEEGLVHTGGDEVEEDLLQFTGVDGPAVGGEAHLQPEGHRPAPDLAAGALQHLLPRAGHRQDAAFAGALGLVGEPGRLPGGPAQQQVLQRHPAPGGIKALLRETGHLAVHHHA